MILYTLMLNKIELNFPNILTIARIALIPLFAIIFYLPFDLARPMCALLFAIAGITDWLDGYLARKMNLVSKFGEFLDPVADKPTPDAPGEPEDPSACPDPWSARFSVGPVVRGCPRPMPTQETSARGVVPGHDTGEGVRRGTHRQTDRLRGCPQNAKVLG